MKKVVDWILIICVSTALIWGLKKFLVVITPKPEPPAAAEAAQENNTQRPPEVQKPPMPADIKDEKGFKNSKI